MKRKRDVLQLRELEKIMEITSDNFTGHRNKALLYVNYCCCLRISESLALRVDDYADNCLFIRNGKGGKSRHVHIKPSARLVLEEWLKYRGEQPEGAPIFCTRKGKPMDRNNANRMLKLLANKAGIKKRAHTHQLRYSGATHMQRTGKVRLDLIQSQLGHANLATTSIYLLQLDPAERMSEMESLDY